MPARIRYDISGGVNASDKLVLAMLTCLCGFSCGTKVAWERHLAKVAEDAPAKGEHGPTPQTHKILALREKFAKYDATHDSKLDFTEMSNLLRKGNPDLTDKELQALFNSADKDKNDRVDFDEFVDHIFSTTAEQDIPSLFATLGSKPRNSRKNMLLPPTSPTQDTSAVLSSAPPSPSTAPPSPNLSANVRLLLIRHARSANKTRNSDAAASLDPDLSDKGYEQAEALGRRLASDFKRMEAGDVIVASSPMRRCLLTILPAVGQLNLLAGDCLCQGYCYEYGCAGTEYAGSSQDAINTEFPEFQPVGFNEKGTWDYRGSNTRETEDEARARAVRIVEWIWDTAQTLSLRGRSRFPKTLILTIHQTMADLICQLLINGSSAEWVYGEVMYRLTNTGITEVTLENNGQARFGFQNSSNHLINLAPTPTHMLNGKEGNAKRIAELRQLFLRFDKTGDRRLDFGEMSALLRKGNPNLSDQELWKLFDGADTTNDGDVDFEEFVEFIFSKDM